MITKVYVIYDAGAEESSQSLFFAKNNNVACRLFQNAVSEHIVKIKGVRLDLFKLVLVGSFDTEKCTFIPADGSLHDRVLQSGNEVELYEIEEEASPVVAAPVSRAV